MEAISKFELAPIVAMSKTIDEVVQRTGLSRSKLLRLMRMYGMSTKLSRPGGNTAASYGDLYSMYVIERRSLRDIAKHYGVSHQAVSNWLKVHRIETRKAGTLDSDEN